MNLPIGLLHCIVCICYVMLLCMHDVGSLFLAKCRRYTCLSRWLYEYCNGADRGICQWTTEEQVW